MMYPLSSCASCDTDHGSMAVCTAGRFGHIVRGAHKISGAVAGDSSLQDRGVAHYLLPLLFSLVSLLVSFCFRVFYQKHQKNSSCLLLLPWVPLKTPSCMTS